MYASENHDKAIIFPTNSAYYSYFLISTLKPRSRTSQALSIVFVRIVDECNGLSQNRYYHDRSGMQLIEDRIEKQCSDIIRNFEKYKTMSKAI